MRIQTIGKPVDVDAFTEKVVGGGVIGKPRGLRMRRRWPFRVTLDDDALGSVSVNWSGCVVERGIKTRNNEVQDDIVIECTYDFKPTEG